MNKAELVTQIAEGADKGASGESTQQLHRCHHDRSHSW